MCENGKNTNLNKGESGLFDALNNDWADTSRSHKVELGQLLGNMMTIILMMRTTMSMIVPLMWMIKKIVSE